MKTKSVSVAGAVATFIAARLVINTGLRMLYPFLSVFARGVGVELSALSGALTARSLTGALGPALAPFSDHYGRKAGMLFGLGLFTLGSALAALWPALAGLALGLILMNLGNLVFLPATQAYLGDRVAYERRGAMMGLTEMSWSGAFILGVPLMGLLLAWAGWRWPFAVLAVLAAAVWGFIAWRLPADAGARDSAASGQPLARLGEVFSTPAALGALAVALLFTFSNETITLMFGVWMEDAFGLKILALGAASAVIGLSELSGEAASTAWVDRLGKRRSVLVGLALCTLSSLGLLLAGGNVATALVGLFFFYLTFEFALVSYLPLLSELMPGARATLMAVSAACFSLGRALGTLVGPWLYEYGFIYCALAAALLNLLALLILSRVKIH